jgi:hypothetical protein
MAMHRACPWIDASWGGSGAKPERYVLRAETDALYYGITPSSDGIERVEDPARAWIFHTHQRAVNAARQIAAVYGQPVDVVKLS